MKSQIRFSPTNPVLSARFAQSAADSPGHNPRSLQRHRHCRCCHVETWHSTTSQKESRGVWWGTPRLQGREQIEARSASDQKTSTAFLHRPVTPPAVAVQRWEGFPCTQQSVADESHPCELVQPVIPREEKGPAKGEEKIDEVKDLIPLPSRSWGHRGQSVAPWTQVRSRIRA